MTMFDNILNVLQPDYPTHSVFEFTNRFKPQHILGFVLALCTVSFNPYVGQAGIGTINQPQVSNHSLVPFDTVIAQPQMLFLVLDQHLNRPSFQIVSYNASHRSAQIISNNCDMFALSVTAREDNLDRTQLIQLTDSFSQSVFVSFTQAGNVAPDAAVSQNISAVFSKFAFTCGRANRTNRKPSIRLAHTYIMPFSLFAGIDHIGAKIKSIKQNGNIELLRQSSFSDCLGRQFSKLIKWNIQFVGMFFFDIQQRGPWNGDTSVVQTHLKNGVAGSIFASGVVVKFANGLHLFGSFEGLCIIDNEKQMVVLFIEKTREHIQGDSLHYYRFIPDASPEEFAMIGAMSTVSQQLDEFVNRTAMTDAHRQYHRPEITVHMFGNLLFNRFEKSLQFFWDFTDCNHVASLMITICRYKCYRLSRPFLFAVLNNHNLYNRSV
jgi:hypothetical protein